MFLCASDCLPLWRCSAHFPVAVCSCVWWCVVPSPFIGMCLLQVSVVVYGSRRPPTLHVSHPLGSRVRAFDSTARVSASFYALGSLCTHPVRCRARVKLEFLAARCVHIQPGPLLLRLRAVCRCYLLVRFGFGSSRPAQSCLAPARDCFVWSPRCVVPRVCDW